MARQQSIGVAAVVTIVALAAGYLLTDLFRHKAGGSVGHYNVVCAKGDGTRATVEYEQPLWWCDHCKTLHWTSRTLLKD